MRTENTSGHHIVGHAFAWGMIDTDWVHPNLRVVLLYVEGSKNRPKLQTAGYRCGTLSFSSDVSNRKVMAAGNTA